LIDIDSDWNWGCNSMMNIKVVSSVFALALLLAGCSSSENALVKSDPAIRAANCQLIYDWIEYRESPQYADFWYTQVNTYDFYALIEENVFSKIQDGDSSYDVILQIRNMEYDSNLYNAPPLGTPVTQANRKQYSMNIEGPITSDSFMSDEVKWKIINSLHSVCNRFTADELADEFAPVLLMD
jgi:hypothetical protein